MCTFSAWSPSWRSTSNNKSSWSVFFLCYQRYKTNLSFLKLTLPHSPTKRLFKNSWKGIFRASSLTSSALLFSTQTVGTAVKSPPEQRFLYQWLRFVPLHVFLCDWSSTINHLLWPPRQEKGALIHTGVLLFAEKLLSNRIAAEIPLWKSCWIEW